MFSSRVFGRKAFGITHVGEADGVRHRETKNDSFHTLCSVIVSVATEASQFA